MPENSTIEYQAAGGIVLHKGRVLVLVRPSRNETRLPKGHIEPGEDAASAAHREILEESGYDHLTLLADLGKQLVKFEYQGVHVTRTEYFFLFLLTQRPAQRKKGEAQFQPKWLPWEEAIKTVSYEAEREWVRRARSAAERFEA